MAIYDEIGTGYDATRKADPYIASRIIHFLNVEYEGLYLDAACGTGNYTIAIASQTKAAFHGIDESEHMIAIARKKSQAIRWSVGDVSSLPYEDNIFSGAICILAIHHFKDFQRACDELFRAISRGRLVIFTSDKKQMEGYWLNEYFPHMMKKSTAIMPGIEEVSLALEAAGFENIVTEKYFVRPDLEDWFLYCGKHEPRMYFNPVIRNGSSGFAAFSDEDEVERGLEKLSQDIESGRIEEVIETYRNEDGDYLFVASEKTSS
jgi:ubiquinone/menaquinone biosynthesis C-methylase UbiE